MKKKCNIFSVIMIFFGAMLVSLTTMAQGTVIAGWTFPTDEPNYAVAAECGTGTLYADGTHGSFNWQDNIQWLGGKAPSTALCDVTATTKTYSPSNLAGNGEALVFAVPTTGYDNIMLSYDTRGTTYGYKTQSWFYSLDGENYTLVEAFSGTNNSTWRHLSVDFSSYTDLANYEMVYFKVQFDSATQNSSNNRLDNIAFTGTEMFPAPTVTIETPIEGTQYELNQPIYADLELTNFDFGNDAVIQYGILKEDQLLVDQTISSMSELEQFEQMDLNASFGPFTAGNYSIFASIIDANAEVLFSDTNHFSIIEPVSDIIVNVDELLFTAEGDQVDFEVTAVNLSDNIVLSVDNDDFEVSPLILASDAENAIVSVVYNGTVETTAVLSLESGDVTTQISLIVAFPEDEGTLLYGTGFEAEEEFASTNSYTNSSVRMAGPEGQQWGVFYGAPSTTGALFGNQSMQMRWRTTCNFNPYAFTDFGVDHVQKVKFFAASTSGNKVEVAYTTDGGTTYVGNQVFDLTDNATEYTYIVSESGEYTDVRLRFVLVVSEDSVASSRLYLDSVRILGYIDNTPVLTTSVDTMFFTELNVPQTLSVSSRNLTSNITLSVDQPDFQLSDTEIESNVEDVMVSVSCVGTDNETATLTLSSNEVEVSVILVYIPSSGIEENLEGKMNIVPNPTCEQIVISAEWQSGQVEILNALGQVIYRNNTPVFPLTVSLANQNAGLYFVRFISTDHQITVKKISKL